MSNLDTIITEARKISEAQAAEVLAMAKGMDAAHKIEQARGA